MSIVFNPSIPTKSQRGSILSVGSVNIASALTSGNITSFNWGGTKTQTNFQVSNNWTINSTGAVQVVCNEAGMYQFSWLIYMRQTFNPSSVISFHVQTTQQGESESLASLEYTNPSQEVWTWVYPKIIQTFSVGDFIRPRFSSTTDTTFATKSISFEYVKID